LEGSSLFGSVLEEDVDSPVIVVKGIGRRDVDGAGSGVEGVVAAATPLDKSPVPRDGSSPREATYR